VKSARGQTHGVYGKGKMKISSTSKKTKIVTNVFYVPGFMTLEKIMIYLTRKLNKKQVILTFG
jgi:hypothetical protein